MNDTIDRLREIIQRGAAFSEEQDAIALALQVLSLDLTKTNLDHPLVALYRTLYAWERGSGMIYLSRQQRKFLRQAIYLLEHNLDADILSRLQLGALADRLRLMARRRVASADNYKDVDQALNMLGTDYYTQNTPQLLLNLHSALVGILLTDHQRQLSPDECKALIDAAQELEERAKP